MPVPFARSASQTRPTFSRDFAGLKTLDHGAGPAITFTRASNATYFNASGVLQTAGNNEPRFDHSSTGSLGLLIEEERTNSIRNSQAGGAVVGSPGTLPTNWSANLITGISREVVATGTINGFSYIDLKFSGTNTSGASGSLTVNVEAVAQIVASSGQSWSGSIYMALIAGSFSGTTSPLFRIFERDASGVAIVSTSTDISGASSTMSRFVVSRTLSGVGVARVSQQLGWTVANNSSVDFTLRIAAPQLEQGAFATSYIPTTNAAATRSADSAVVTPISSFYNQSEGTLFAEASRTHVAKNVSFIEILNGADQSRSMALETGVAVPTQQRYQVLDGSSIANLTHAAAGVANTVYKMIGTYAANYFIAAQNGVLTSANTLGIAPTTMTRLSIGSRVPEPIAGSQINNSQCHIRKIAYWPKRLSNTLLQQLTT